jgi:hypothetical protein
MLEKVTVARAGVETRGAGVGARLLNAVDEALAGEGDSLT